MLQRSLPLACLAILTVICGCGDQEKQVSPQAKGAEDQAQGADGFAETAFGILLEEYRSGKTGLAQIERLNDWSERIVQSSSFGVQGVPADILWRPHIERLTRLEELAKRKVAAGEADPTDQAAATFFRHRAEQLSDQMRTLLDNSELDFVIPEPASEAPATTFEIRLNEDSQILIGEQVYSRDELRTRLRKLARMPGAPKHIRVIADEKSRHRDVVAILQMCSELKLECSLITN
ncbi:MAG: hypothetical protein KY475_02365 [Planctomycetes bacterium]|nr:hypothetical protein [Planctomycetota bacterium]